VNNLKGELESTFKEEISVYFDINPHDGLLETHDVDESLKEKLKCLVFIPIISRTYCDPKSFAWEHEFKAFIDLSSKDRFGLKIKLPNGNVAGRVLPVRIHDLDSADIKECESVIGGVLRGVEFIYKEPGFNRPLNPDDDEKVNLNKSKYRNQITKVALAIKEISLGMKAVPISVLKEKMQERESFKEILEEEEKIDLERPAKAKKARFLIPIAVVAILIIAVIIAYPKIFKRNALDRLRASGERISVAVMPFMNMTNDITWNVWQDGIQDNLITSLSNSKELKVRQTESVTSLLQNSGLTNYASITHSVASAISQKLVAKVFICGSIKQADSTLQLNAQLVDSKTEEVFKSFQIDGSSKRIIRIVDSLSLLVKNFLILSKLKEEVSPDIRIYEYSNSPDAYRYFIYGNNAAYKRDYSTAVKMFLQAMAIDSDFIAAKIFLSMNYENQGLYEDAKKWCLKAYKRRDQMPRRYEIMTNWLYADIFETPQEANKYLKQYQELDDQLPIVNYLLGMEYNGLDQFDKAIPEFEKALKINERMDLKPTGSGAYTSLGYAFHNTRQYKKEKKLYKEAERYFPDDAPLLYRQAVMSLTEGDTVASNQYIEKYVSIRKDNSWPEAAISESIAEIYSEAGILDKAEDYYRKALSLQPDNDNWKYYLAMFLIDKDRNINQGLELIDQTFKVYPKSYLVLDCKGWGLYKQGKYEEALALLKRSWELKPKYDHDLYLHLEAANKAVAEQTKNN
jgi:tetratricopeptide (TPR) repeat protein